MSHIKLQSSDGIVFTTGLPFVEFCGTIEKMMARGEIENDVVELPFNSSLLTKIIEWINHHKHNAEINNIVGNPEIPEWDEDFFAKTGDAMLKQVIEAAHYLNIKGLYYYGTKSISKPQVQTTYYTGATMGPYWNGSYMHPGIMQQQQQQQQQPEMGTYGGLPQYDASAYFYGPAKK